MEGSHEYWTWMKRKQILTSQLQVEDDGKYYSSWEERAFAEDAARILGGSTWPPRSYSCNFCKREFRSAQALGGHMNIHRRDRARLKQNLSPHNNTNNDFKTSSLGNHFSAATSITTTTTISPYSSSSSSSSIIYGQNKLQEEVFNAKGEKNLKDLLSCDDNYVETTLSLTSVFGQKSPCGDKDIIMTSCKGLKTNISSLPDVSLKPCSKDRCLALQPSEMDELDLELRLGIQQKVM